MRTRVNKKPMGLAIGFFAAAVVSFGIASTNSATSPGPRCVRPDLSNTEIHECVAERARDTEPNGAMLALLLVGGASFTASLVTGIRSLRRVMTIAEAAEGLGIPPGEVRQLIDQGFLEIYDRKEGAIYLNPEDVRRLSSNRKTQDRPAHA
jgi:hypothetical protein